MRRTFLALSLTAALFAQEKSVKPGINDSFKDPNVQEWEARLQAESREVFDKRTAILNALDLKPGMAVADVGAGTGLYTMPFAERVGAQGKVFAVDISPKFLQHIERGAKLKGLGNIITIQAGETSANLPANSVDLIFLSDTYHHIEFPAKTLASLQQALKPGGRLAIVDFKRIPGVSTEWTLSHVRAGQDVVEQEVTAAGFKKTAEPAVGLKENYLVVFAK